MSKHYILFTDDEFADMMNGEEIEYPLESGKILYFMSEEEFKRKNREPSESDWRDARTRLYTMFLGICLDYGTKKLTTNILDDLIILHSLKTRYENGERSKELYDAIMKITKKRYI